jgi:preprotein translocase subunit SecF
MFTLINPNTNFDFMKTRKTAFMVSLALTVGSIVLLLVKGLNLGIEFKGGSSAIVAFEKGAIDARQAIGDSVTTLLTTELGHADSTVSVQDFGAGAGDQIDGRQVDRFLIYTEVTSLVDATKREAVIAAIKAKFGAGTKVASSEDAGDTLYLTFEKDAGISSRKDELKEIFKGLGFESITVTTDFERQVEVEFLRDVDLQRQDRENAGGSQASDALAGALPTQVDFERRRAAAVEGKEDRRFTVDIEALQAAFHKQLSKDFGAKFIAVESSATVSPSVGEDLFNDGLLAILYSLIGILIYVTLRFDFRYAPGGVIALFHDAIVTMGMVAALDLKFSLQILAAVLTIIGYSINDSIVVYDRIRELYSGQKGQSFIDLLNKAVNQTLSRTVLTGTTTLLGILSIMVFGGAQVYDFALTMFLGIIFGTYSSIYISVPVVIYLDNYFQRREEEQAARLNPQATQKKAAKADDKKAQSPA